MHAGTPEPQRHLHSSAHLPSSNAADISCLLDGLGADDFDDFDDGAEYDPASARRTPSPEIDEYYTPPAPAPAEVPSFVAFATASGRALAKPSEAAMSRALKIVREAERDAELEDAPSKRRRTESPAPPPAPAPVAGLATPAAVEPSSSHVPIFANAPPESPLVHKSGFGLASGRDAPPPSDAARARALAFFSDDEQQTPANPAGFSTGFKLGNGSSAPPPSSDARARGLALFGKERTPAGPGPSSFASSSGFQLGSGSAAPPPPTDARARALALFGEDKTPARPAEPESRFQLGSGSAAPPPPDARTRALALFPDADSVAGPSQPPTSGFSTGFQTASGKAAQAPRGESMAFALALFNDEPTPSSPGAAPQRPSSPSFSAPRPNRPPSPSFTAPRPTRPNSFSAPARPSTPSRVPLATMTNTFTNARSTPVMKLPKRINVHTPSSTPRRIGLGAGMGSARGKQKKGFVTPFKSSGARSVSGPSALRTPIALRPPIALRTPAKKPPEPPKIYNSVFDLTVPPNRQGMRAAFFYPGFYPPAELREMGLPNEIWELNLSNALYYQFIGEDSSVLGTAQALGRLKIEGCELATQKWVDNHWRLILWKIAGQAMAKPSLFDQKWNWYEVLCQLRYRYEREYGAAQRPIVRRIQEHDSSPSLPMILCVAGIHRPPPIKNEQDEDVPQKPYIDLTDGWYIIRALLDDCLARALGKGRIRVGRKLGLSGAKLESGSDGADVLEAYDKSHLVLSGNSTHLAKWDTKLGLQRQPFVAGLSSLSVDGGPIVLMDLILDRVFPIAYVSGDRSSREQPWGEDEERERSDAWKDKYEAESTRLREDLQKSLEKIQELASILASHAEDCDVSPSASPPDVEADFDELMDARNVMTRLRALPGIKIVALATYARQRAMEEAESGRAEIEAELASACPPRAVRDFRMVRVRDAREGNREQARTAMLNVWEAKALGELKEGKRFLVSGLVPGRMGDWATPKAGTVREVYLHTRRDTRWQLVE